MAATSLNPFLTVHERKSRQALRLTQSTQQSEAKQKSPRGPIQGHTETLLPHSLPLFPSPSFLVTQGGKITTRQVGPWETPDQREHQGEGEGRGGLEPSEGLWVSLQRAISKADLEKLDHAALGKCGGWHRKYLISWQADWCVEGLPHSWGGDG